MSMELVGRCYKRNYTKILKKVKGEKRKKFQISRSVITLGPIFTKNGFKSSTRLEEKSQEVSVRKNVNQRRYNKKCVCRSVFNELLGKSSLNVFVMDIIKLQLQILYTMILVIL